MSTISVDKCFAAHITVSDSTDLDDLKQHIVYEDEVSPGHLVMYGKSRGFFTQLISLEIDGAIKLNSLIGPPQRYVQGVIMFTLVHSVLRGWNVREEKTGAYMLEHWTQHKDYAKDTAARLNANAVAERTVLRGQ